MGIIWSALFIGIPLIEALDIQWDSQTPSYQEAQGFNQYDQEVPTRLFPAFCLLPFCLEEQNLAVHEREKNREKNGQNLKIILSLSSEEVRRLYFVD